MARVSPDFLIWGEVCKLSTHTLHCWQNPEFPEIATCRLCSLFLTKVDYFLIFPCGNERQG